MLAKHLTDLKLSSQCSHVTPILQRRNFDEDKEVWDRVNTGFMISTLRILFCTLATLQKYPFAENIMAFFDILRF